VPFLLAVLALTAAAVGLRLYHQTSAYELFMDEIEYADVGNSFAAGGGPELFGAPFFLHPPLFFTVLGAVIGTPVAHMTAGFVLGLRWVSLVPAALDVLLVVGVTRRVAGRRPALVAGALYALDPFVIRFDSRLMLEAPSMCLVLGGLWLALVAVDRADAGSRRRLLAAAGLLFGLALLTKSTAVLVTLVPLLLVLATGWGLRRAEAVLVLAVQAVVQVGYLAWLVLTGRVGAWYDQTLSGLARAVGLVKQTGFTSPHAPSLPGRALAQLGMFGPSYLLIAVACGCVVLRIARVRSGLRADDAGPGPRAGRLLTCWLGGVLVALAYTYAFGEVEEQTFYLLVVPATVVVALLSRPRVRRPGRHRVHTGRPRVPAAVVVLLAVVLAGSAGTWTRVHLTRDDAYQQMIGWMDAEVPAGTPVALGEGTAQFVLPGYPLHALVDLDRARAADRYALVSTELTDLGLAPAGAHVVQQLQQRCGLAHAVAGRTVGELRLYDLRTCAAGSR
jgi:hypothetical protein